MYNPSTMNQPLDTISNFNGLTVISFESRMAESMSRMIETHQGKVISAPSMQEIPLDKNPEAFDFMERLLKGEVGVIIFMTGVGVRYLLQILETQYAKEEIVKAWSSVMVVCRGPKPVKPLKELGVPITITVPEPNTWHEILDELDHNERSVSLEGKVIAIQEYGVSNEQLIHGLKERGSHVIQVPVYRWALPDNLDPLLFGIDSIIKGEVKLAFFTTAMQVNHIFKVASERGLEEKLKKAFQQVVIASVGPKCSETIISNGLPVDFEPSHPKMGPLVKEAAEASQELVEKKQAHLSVSLSSKEKFQPTVTEKKQDGEALHNSLFLKACRRESVDQIPVWLMRQAGRYMKEYRDIRNKVSFLELCKTPELVTQVTVEAQEKIGADAAIIFADILLIVEPLGLSLEFEGGQGPVIGNSLETEKDIKAIPEINPEESLGYVFDAIKMTRQYLSPDVPLIGFSGAPFTLCSYMIEGGSSRNFAKTKTLMYSLPELWDLLMQKVTHNLVAYLVGQVKAGAQVVQLFDSWVGSLGPEDYQKYVLPHMIQLIQAFKKQCPDCPVIHFGTGNPLLLSLMKEAGGNIIGADFRIEIDQAWNSIGEEFSLMGNLDPLVLYADKKVIKEKAEHILKKVAHKPGFIFNLGHGILPNTPVENVQYLIDVVHDFKV